MSLWERDPHSQPRRMRGLIRDKAPYRAPYFVRRRLKGGRRSSRLPQGRGPELPWTHATSSKPGMSAERILVVPPERTVGHFVAGMPMVYATPMMILEMEMASGDAIRGYLATGWVTVGTEVDIKHLGGVAGRRHRADHGKGDRGGAPRHPLRGRSLRGRAQDRRGPPRPRPRQCREFQQAAGEVAIVTPSRCISLPLIQGDYHAVVQNRRFGACRRQRQAQYPCPGRWPLLTVRCR